MSLALVDTSVILDIVTDDPKWADWSIETLHRFRKQGRLAINPKNEPSCFSPINLNSH
jgi:hypothetical protein